MARKNLHHDLIPDFDLANDFVYFYDLIDPKTQINNPPLTKRKTQLWEEAQQAITSINDSLISIETLNTAFEFIRLIAENERKKELAVVKKYCDKIKKQYPKFTNFTEEDILNNPDDFYKELIRYINEAKQTAQSYQDQLYRIKKNTGQINADLKKESRADYSKDNYLYRLASDSDSLFKKLVGTFEGNNESEQSFSNKIQTIVIDIMNQLNLANYIQSGEDFAAIALAILADIENKIQQEYDKQFLRSELPSKLEDISQTTLDLIKQAYIDNIESQNEGTGVQQALKNLNSDEYFQIITNVKNTFNISTIQDSKQLQTQLAAIKQKANKKRGCKGSQNQLMNNLHNMFSKKRKLHKQLQGLQITRVNTNSFHGNIAELVESILTNNSRLLGSSGSAVDVISYEISITLQPNEKIIREYVTDIGDNIMDFTKKDIHEKDALSRDLSSNITTMNNNVDTTLKELDQLLKQQENPDSFFIFHESLKLYSSIETGKNATGGFEGRNLNILTGLDYIKAAMDSAGVSFPETNGTLRMLALNLSNLALGKEHNYKHNLEEYLSLFAGLLMFDDVVNIAREAVNTIQYDYVNVIHLYLLNGIYVPSSTILTYIYNNCIKALSIMSEKDAATVKITTDGADKAINNWLATRPWPTLDVWQNTGLAAASGTKIHIVFFAGFIKFISSL